MSNLKAGQQIGPWKLLEPLGKGGNGLVWKVRDAAGAFGALKVLRDTSDRKRGERLADEIVAMQSCRDIPGVLPLLDSNVPTHPCRTNPAWLVSAVATPITELIEKAQTLKDIVGRVHELARTLADMHAKGFSHRDVKPENILELNGRWCLGDFGLADFPDKIAQTAEGEKLGPMFYIAPEMLNEAAKADGTKADVYSLGKLFWKLATGQKYPLPGTHRRDTQALTISGAVAGINVEPLDGLLEAMTEFSPQRRPSMANVVQELEMWLQPKPMHNNGDDDLASRKSRVLALTERFRSKERELKTRRDDAEAALSKAFKRLASPMHRIRERFASANLGEFTIAPPTGGFEFYRALNGDLHIGSGSVAGIIDHQFSFNLRVWAGDKWSELRGGVNLGVRSTSDGAPDIQFPVLTAAGLFADTHVMMHGSWKSIRHVIWVQGGEFFLGQPSEAHLLDRFGVELESRVGTAVDKLLDLHEIQHPSV